MEFLRLRGQDHDLGLVCRVISKTFKGTPQMWAVGEKTKKPLFFDLKKTMSEMGKTLGSKIFAFSF